MYFIDVSVKILVDTSTLSENTKGQGLDFPKVSVVGVRMLRVDWVLYIFAPTHFPEIQSAMMWDFPKV